MLCVDPTPLGSYLRELRHRAGLSQRAAAASAGVSFPHISKVEAGHEVPSAELLEALAKAYGVHEDELLLAAERLPQDVEDAVIEKKDLAPQFLRSWRSGKITDDDVRKLLVESDEDLGG
jgi:transcriptional regulator with XRE-family HTH domain